jgi:chromosome segregation ATPase
MTSAEEELAALKRDRRYLQDRINDLTARLEKVEADIQALESPDCLTDKEEA